MYLLELNLRLAEDKRCLNTRLGFRRPPCRLLDPHRPRCLKSARKAINSFKFSKFIKSWRRLSSFILLTRELFNKTFPKCPILKTRVNFACGCSAELNLYYLEIISCWSCLEEWWWTWATIWCMMRRWSHLWHGQYFWLLTFFGLLTVEEQTEFFLINTLMIWNWKYSVLR